MCWQAGREARGVWEGGGGDGAGADHGVLRQPERQTQGQRRHRRLWAALRTSHCRRRRHLSTFPLMRHMPRPFFIRTSRDCVCDPTELLLHQLFDSNGFKEEKINNIMNKVWSKIINLINADQPKINCRIKVMCPGGTSGLHLHLMKTTELPADYFLERLQVS